MSPSGLARMVQSDFGFGSQPDAARRLIDPRAVEQIFNGLLDNDGLIYRRGGATYKNTEAFQPDSVGMRWIWNGHVHAGQRTVMADSDGFGVSIVDDDSEWLVFSAPTDGLDFPVRPAVIEGMLFIPSTTPGGDSYIYAGSRQQDTFTDNAVTVTNGSNQIDFAVPPDWDNDIDAGMLMQVEGDARVYVLDHEKDPGEIILRDAYEGVSDPTVTASFYPIFKITDGAPYRASAMYAAAGNRLLAAEGNKVYECDLDLNLGVTKPHSWPATNFHALPEGVEVLALDAIGDAALAFTTAGIAVIQGLSLELVDDLGNPQQRLDFINRELVVWERAGITPWQNGLVVPAHDGIYLIDAVSPPTPLGSPVESLYRHYVSIGYRPGAGAIYRQHFFLPILDAAGRTKDLLVARLDRPVPFRGGLAFPWARQRGSGAQVAALTVRQQETEESRPPELLAAGNNTDARVVRCDSYFEPSSAVANDPGGVPHVLTIITRDYLVGDLGKARVRRLRLGYELTGSGDEDDPAPHISLDYSTGELHGGATLWGQFQWGQAQWSSASDAGFFTLAEQAPPDPRGLNPYTWHLNKWVRSIRFRIRSSGLVGKLAIKNLELFVATPQNVRH